jgi:hypothetical protein
MEIAEALVLGPDLLPHRGSDRDVHGLLSRYGAYRSRLRFHTADAANRCEAVVVSPCMLMTVVDVPGPDPFESQVSGQDLIEFHFRLSGRMVLAGGFGEVALEDPSLLLWYQPTGCDDVRERLGSPDRPRERWVSLYCDRGWLREMGSRETDSLLERLAPSPDSGDAPRFLVQPSIGAALPVLREIVAMHSAVSHPLAWLHASAKAMELLHVTLRDKSMLLDGGERRFRLTSRDRHLLGPGPAHRTQHVEAVLRFPTRVRRDDVRIRAAATTRTCKDAPAGDGASGP